MRAFSVLAMLAVAACAVDMQLENPYKDLFGSGGMSGKDSSKNDQDDGNNTVKVDVWDTVDSELGDLMDEVNALLKIVDEQGNSLMGTQMTFTMLMNEVADIRDSNLANSSSLASQNAIDASQDKKLHKLDDKVEKYEDKVAQLTNDVDLLKKKVENLPALDDLIERLGVVAGNNISLMSMAGLQESDLVTTVGIVTDLTATVTTLEEHNDAFEMAIDEANEKIGMTLSQTNLNLEALDNESAPLGLTQKLETQTIVANYLEVNDAAIELTDGQITLPTSFTQCTGETLEFHLTLTDEAGLLFMDNTMESAENELTLVTLFADMDPVATSTTLDSSDMNDGGVSGYRHSLFYKTTNSGATKTYTIKVTAIGTNTDDDFAMIQPNNLQWGYIMWGEGYLLGENPLDSECSSGP